MSRFVRQSKYRHVFGDAAKPENSFQSIKVTRSAWDTDKVTASCKFMACIWEAGGGGAFVVKRNDQLGKAETSPPLVAGHTGEVLDIKFSPHNDNLIASSSVDCLVKVWQIPDEGITENVTEAAQVLKSHRRKVGTVTWHPTASNVLVTSATDYMVKVWDVEAGAEKVNIEGHANTIDSVSFNRDGSLLSTTSKDKKMRIIDPRSAEIVHTLESHQGVKGSRGVFLRSSTFSDKVFTVGFSRSSQRQFALWDLKMLDSNKPIHSTNIDQSSGKLMPFIDDDTSIVYLVGKGDGNIRYYEITDSDKFVYFINNYKSAVSAKGACMVPKRALNISKCEVTRLLKVTNKNTVVPISFTVPRKSDMFQDDIFPDTEGGEPAMTAEQFFAGENAEPKLISLENAYVPPEAPQVEFTATAAVEEKTMTPLEMKQEIDRLEKRVAYLEAEITKRDLQIKELSSA